MRVYRIKLKLWQTKCCLLALLFSQTACYNESLYLDENFKTAEIIESISVDPAVIPADGVSNSEITVKIPKNATSKTIKITTNHGRLSKENGEVEALAGNASLKIYSGTKPEQNVEIEAEIERFRSSIKMVFEPALAESISIEANQFFVEPGLDKEIALTAILSRSSGKVSEGSQVDFLAVDEDGKDIGFFREIRNKSDINEKASVRFSLGTNSVREKIFLVAQTVSVNQGVLSDTLELYLK